MMDYLFDGSFDGLLTCIYEHYYKKNTNNIYCLENYQMTLDTEFEIIETNTTKAKKVSNAVLNKISKKAYEYIYYVFLSNNDNKFKLILEFVIFGFKEKRDISDYYEHDKVYPIYSIYRNVEMEVFRFIGLLRFTEVNGILYSKYHPDHNITELLAPHFSDRLKCENFIIHDVGRKTGAISSEGTWYMTDIDDNFLNINNFENEYKNLWKHYFNHIAIKERINLKLQYQKVPIRYRKNIIEFNK